MRQHRAVSLCVTGSLLVGLAGCAADSMKSSSEPQRTGPIAQAEQGKDQPPSGEVQERAVPGLPGTRPGIVFPGTPPPGAGAVTIQSVSAEPCCNLPWYTTVSYKIQLTAPAPPAGFPVSLNISSPTTPLITQNPFTIIDPATPLQFSVLGGQQTRTIPVRFKSVPTPVVVSINAVEGLSGRLTGGPTFTVLPPRVTAVTFGIGGPGGVQPTGGVIGGVPPGGQQMIVTVSLDSPAPDALNSLGVLSYNVSYAAQGSGNYPTSGVTGPSQFRVTAQFTLGGFPITVFPCHGTPCRVIVTVSPIPAPGALNPVQGILQVNP